MPRNTRAAKKAKETEIEIAEDDIHHQAPDDAGATIRDKKAGISRPALVEMTANAVEELSQAIDVKNDNRKETVKGRKPKAARKRGKSKPKSHDQSSEASSTTGKTESEASERDENEDPHVEEALEMSPATETATSTSREDVEPVATLELKEADEPKKDEVEAHKAQEVVEAQLEPFPAFEPPAIQKLESLFTEPTVEVDATEPADTPLTAAPVQPLPPSPAKRVSASPQRSTKSSESKAQKPAAKDTVKGHAPSSVKAKGPVTVKKAPTGAASRNSLQGGGRRPSSIVKTRVSTANKPSPKAPPKASPSSTPAPKEKKERTVAALNTPPKLAKSNKAPTTSTFQLPSEALKEKFKVQKEERQRRQEEQAHKQKKDPPKPSIPPKHTTKPRATPVNQSTPAHRPRLSTAGTITGQPTTATHTRHVTALPWASSTVRPVRRASTVPEKRPAATVRTSRPAGGRTSSVNKPISEKPAGGRMSISKPSEPLMTAAQKAEAAKRARAEAAEKGRAASREWAEKKKKEVDARKAAEEEKIDPVVVTS